MVTGPQLDHYFTNVCQRKHAYATKDRAHRAMTYFKHKGKGPKKPVRVYECPICRGWHITSKEKGYER